MSSDDKVDLASQLAATFCEGAVALAAIPHLVCGFDIVLVNIICELTTTKPAPWGLIPPHDRDGAEWQWDADVAPIHHFAAWSSDQNQAYLRAAIASADVGFVLLNADADIAALDSLLAGLSNFESAAYGRLPDALSHLRWMMIPGGADLEVAAVIPGVHDQLLLYNLEAWLRAEHRRCGRIELVEGMPRFLF